MCTHIDDSPLNAHTSITERPYERVRMRAHEIRKRKKGRDTCTREQGGAPYRDGHSSSGLHQRALPDRQGPTFPDVSLVYGPLPERGGGRWMLVCVVGCECRDYVINEQSVGNGVEDTSPGLGFKLQCTSETVAIILAIHSESQAH